MNKFLGTNYFTMKKVLFILLVFVLPVKMTCFAQEQKDSLQLVHLQQVEVVATRATEKTPLIYSELDKKAIERINFGQDIPFILTLTPSVVTTSDAGTGIGYTGFRIRGTDANRINITTNGIPMNDSESQGVFWVNIPDFASSLEDLQVQRGVGTSTNGAGAFGASINLKTEKIPSKPYGEFNGSYGSFNTSKATVKLGTGQIGNHWAFDARLSSINSDGYVDRASVDLKSYFLQASYYHENTLLKFIVYGGKEQTYHAWNGIPTDSLRTNRTYNPSGYMGDDNNGRPLYYDSQTDNYLQTNYQLNWMQILSPSLKLNASLHYTKGDGYYEEYKQEQSLVKYALQPFSYDGETIAASDLVRRKKMDNGFGGMVFSLNYHPDKLDLTLGGGGNYYDGNHFGNVIWVKNYAGDTGFYPEHEYYRNVGEKTDINIYLKGNYQLTDKVSIYGDVQYRHIHYDIDGKNDKWNKFINDMQQLDVHESFDFFNPKAGVFFQLNPENNVYASLAIAHREPNRNNYTDAGFNEKPKAERLQDYELGYVFKNETFHAGLNFYYMKYKDQLILNGRVNEIGEPLTSNIPDSYRLGMEVTAGVRLTHWLDWDGNITLSDNKIKNYTEYVEDWETGNYEPGYLGTTPIAYSPGIIANSLFSLNYQSWSAGFQSSYVGKQYLDNSGSNDRKLNPYFVNNLRLGYTLPIKGIRSLAFNVLINNLFNEKYASNGYIWYSWYEGSGNDRTRGNDLRYFPQAGTNVLFNLALKF